MNIFTSFDKLPFFARRYFTTQIFYDDAVKREILGRSLFGLKYKARFLEDTVSKNELILRKCDGSGKVTF